MVQDKKTPNVAPSTDTTSALFVSARKKQIEQQEAERRAKEKEEARLAAEAEVRRLEQEVEERRQKAERDKVQVEADAASAAAAAKRKLEDDFAASLRQPSPGAPAPDVARPSAQPTKGSLKKILPIAGGALGLIILVIVLIAVLGSKKELYLTDKGLDVSGLFYGTEPNVKVNFTPDGAIEYQDTKLVKAKGEYSIKGETVIASAAGVEMTFEVESDGTLTDGLGGKYTRTPPPVKKEPVKQAAAPTTPAKTVPAKPKWVLNPDARLDTVVIIQTMKFGFSYPIVTFKLTEHTGDRSTLTSLDGETFINHMLLLRKQKGLGRIKESEMKKSVDLVIQTYREVGLKTNKVIYNNGRDKVVAAYFDGYYTSEKNTKRYVYAAFIAWKNVTDQSNQVIVQVLNCPVEQADNYLKVYAKILNSQFDA
ncbi:MAG: hypothetical protein LBI10_07055 [Deltaproteobacteria bacterium]|jgi:hypothetical protein|nr:hypothetical protein [Deltaproteobacteria bacterium]